MQLHRIEALPGSGRFALTFRTADATEHSVVAEVRADAQVTLAAASLPPGCEPGTEAFAATVAAITAFAAVRSAAPAAALQDVPGGWDVGLGNVELGPAGNPRCTAHGDLVPGAEGVWTCAECGAQARYG